MKGSSFAVLIIIMLLFSCAPVLRKELMDTATRDIPFLDVTENPDIYRGRLFALGGIIVDTRITEKGSLIEVVYVPVDSRGYLKEVELLTRRFLAFYPRDKGLLDPTIYRRGREISLVGEFIETRKGKIDEMEYIYPLFEIKELHLWEEKKPYYIAPPYPYWWYNPWWGYYYPPPPPYYWYKPPQRY